MKVKRKFIIALTSLIAVVAISVIAIVAIFAAMNTSIQSGISITYNAVDVSATVKANYIIGSTSVAMVTDSGEDEIVFQPNSDANGSFKPPSSDEIELNSINNSVVFEYIFTNDSNTLDVAIDLDTTAFSVNNMDIAYAYSYDKIINTSTMPTTNNFEPMMILGEEREGGFFETLYVYVKVSISNIADDAYFEGNMDFSLTKATPVKLTFENVENATNNVLLQTRIVPLGTSIESIPTPIFDDGEVYDWYTYNDLETHVEFPMDITEDKTIYAGITSYVIDVSENGIYTLSNVSDSEVYVHIYYYRDFSYGVKYHKNKYSDEGYAIVAPGQTVSFKENLSHRSVKTEQPSNFESRNFFAAYGAYPQTYVGKTLNEELQNSKLNATGKTYTVDIDMTTYTLFEYSYKGKLYAKLDGCSKYNGTGVCFANGELVQNDQIYFFYVEPIVAQVCEMNDDGTYTLMSLDTLGSRIFNNYNSETTTSDGVATWKLTSWQYSLMRGYLNSTFLSESGLENIALERTVKNNTSANYYDGTSGDTIDRVWLPSVEEMLRWSNVTLTDELNDSLGQNGASYTISHNISRSEYSDLARATYSYQKEGYGRYYLRSAGYYRYTVNGDYIVDSYDICRINHGGNIYTQHDVYTSSTGYRPVFVVSI